MKRNQTNKKLKLWFYDQKLRSIRYIKLFNYRKILQNSILQLKKTLALKKRSNESYRFHTAHTAILTNPCTSHQTIAALFRPTPDSKRRSLSNSGSLSSAAIYLYRHLRRRNAEVRRWRSGFLNGSLFVRHILCRHCAIIITTDAAVRERPARLPVRRFSLWGGTKMQERGCRIGRLIANRPVA